LELVTINKKDPWTAATESFGGNSQFLEFNALSIAFRDENGTCRTFSMHISRTHCLPGNVHGRRIARNVPFTRPWGITADFQCLTPNCKARPFDVTVYDDKKHRRKSLSCHLCKKVTDWVSFSDVECLFSNKLFPGNRYQDVYWTPWPLDPAAGGLFQINYKKIAQRSRKGEKHAKQLEEKGEKKLEKDKEMDAQTPTTSKKRKVSSGSDRGNKKKSWSATST
jgi:hypothetical protein